jgi:hypothetical protein
VVVEEEFFLGSIRDGESDGWSWFRAEVKSSICSLRAQGLEKTRLKCV